MPKTILVPPDASKKYSGISITYTPSAKRIDVFGWYDSCVGIEGASFNLQQFFKELGITQQDCNKAFRKIKPINRN